MRMLLPLLLLVSASSANATPAQDRREILRVVQQLFDGLAARSPERILALVVPEGTITAHVGSGPSASMRAQRWQDWANGLRSGAERLYEEMHSPQVRVRGNMASVWTEYTFRRDGRFSHCGVDLFDMAKVGGRWRILNLTFTRETTGCRRR